MRLAALHQTGFVAGHGLDDHGGVGAAPARDQLRRGAAGLDDAEPVSSDALDQAGDQQAGDLISMIVTTDANHATCVHLSSEH
jgi:hypothetical protein